MAVNVGPFIAGIVLFAAGVFVLWLLVYAAGIFRPVVRDESVVGGEAAMERKVLLATGMIIAIGLILTAYGFYDPIRQANAAERQQNTSIERGVETYATLCYPCHGIDGKGAVVPNTDPPRVTPQLNRPDFGEAYQGDPDQFKKTYDLVYKTIQRGRPGTPMPAWGQTDGGTLNDEQILELATFITHGAKQGEFDVPDGHGGSVEGNSPWDAAQKLVEENIAAGSPSPIPVAQAAPPLSPELQAGRQTWEKEGCIGCHTIDGVGGKTGPDLSHIATAAATMKPGMGAEDYIRESILDPNAFVVPGFPANVMPSFKGRMSDDDLNKLIQYYMSLK